MGNSPLKVSNSIVLLLDSVLVVEVSTLEHLTQVHHLLSKTLSAAVTIITSFSIAATLVTLLRTLTPIVVIFKILSLDHGFVTELAFDDHIWA